MFLDSSDDEEDETDIPEPVKDIDSNSDGIIDVPEYAAEIYQYLKAAEVNILFYWCSLKPSSPDAVQNLLVITPVLKRYKHFHGKNRNFHTSY